MHVQYGSVIHTAVFVECTCTSKAYTNMLIKQCVGLVGSNGLYDSRETGRDNSIQPSQ